LGKSKTLQNARGRNRPLNRLCPSGAGANRSSHLFGTPAIHEPITNVNLRASATTLVLGGSSKAVA
jgi:hypothetical protein